MTYAFLQKGQTGYAQTKRYNCEITKDLFGFYTLILTWSKVCGRGSRKFSFEHYRDALLAFEFVRSKRLSEGFVVRAYDANGIDNPVFLVPKSKKALLSSRLTTLARRDQGIANLALLLHRKRIIFIGDIVSLSFSKFFELIELRGCSLKIFLENRTSPVFRLITRLGIYGLTLQARLPFWKTPDKYYEIVPQQLPSRLVFGRLSNIGAPRLEAHIADTTLPELFDENRPRI